MRRTVATFSRPALGLIARNLLAFLGVAALVVLGTWQLQRRIWKHALIEQVETRVHATARGAPGRAEWPDVTADAYAYRRVQVAGTFLHDRSTLVQALTALGGGYWVMTPLRTEASFIVLINRGFVPSGKHGLTDWRRPEGKVSLTGLLRISEPRGAFLRTNDPASDRWYARDVDAIARARSLDDVAPYFIDVEKGTDEALPVGGLTVVNFPDNHLAYALTWYALALMLIAATIYVDRRALDQDGGS